MDFSYVHIRYFIGYVYHICLQDTIQSTQSLCLLCQAMLLPMPLRPLLLTTRSGFNGWGSVKCLGAVDPQNISRMGFRQIFGACTPPKYLTDGVPSNIWGL